MAGKRSDIEKQIADLQATLDTADTDDEVWIKDGDHEVKVTGKRATTILGRYSSLFAEGDDKGDGDGDGDGDDEDDKSTSFFKSRKK